MCGCEEGEGRRGGKGGGGDASEGLTTILEKLMPLMATVKGHLFSMQRTIAGSVQRFLSVVSASHLWSENSTQEKKLKLKYIHSLGGDNVFLPPVI